MPRFAVIAPPLRGHFAPLSVLAGELIARGHEVTFIHQEDARSLVEGEGASFESIGDGEEPLERWTRPMSRIRGVVGLGGMMQRMEGFTTMFCREAPPLLRSLGIDAIIADQLEPAGGLLAEALGLPWVSVASALPLNREMGVPPPYLHWRFDPSPRGIGRNRAGWKVSDWLMRSFNAVIEDNARKLGLKPRTRIEDCFSPRLQIAQMVKGLDFPRSSLPDTFHYTGPFRWSGNRAFALPPGTVRPLLFASLGTLQGSRSRLFRNIACACESLGFGLVISHGGLGDPADLHDLPGNPLVYDWVPQESLLGEVDLVACHGGMNIVLDSLAAGLPLIVMPLAFEQGAIGARVSGSGAGIMLKARSGAARVAEALRTINESPRYRARARALREEIRAAGGVSRAADLIEQALGVSVRTAVPTRAHSASDGARDDSRNGSRSGARLPS